jgi:methylmalonyl-CoA mutase cobalamin-binding domain/chain
LSDVTTALVEMREADVIAGVAAAQAAGESANDIIAALQEGMRIIGDKFESGEFYLSELIMSAELGLDQAAADTDAKATVILGTVRTDIHDIGKNIVASVLSANGFKVVDLGVDVPAAAFVAAAQENDAKLIGLSCLLTTAFAAMKETIEAFAEAGLREQVSIFVGAQEAVMLADHALAGSAS